MLISNIAPEAPFRVYEKSYWFSDEWDACDHGREFDFSKTFAENFRALQLETPRFSIQQQEPMENSDYCNFASNCQNSYFLFDSDYCRDSYFSNVLKKSNNCVDCSFTRNSELCYQCVNCSDCYDVRYSRNSHNCSNSVFLDNCIGCKNCAFCTNLRNKSYCFENEQLSKEEYETKLAELKLEQRSSVELCSSRFKNFLFEHPRRYYHGVQNENVSGDFISRSKNIFQSFDIEEAWDIAYSDLLYRAKNCMDVSSFGENIEWMYECTTAGLDSQNCFSCFTPVVSSSDLYYCDTAYASKNCFACVCIHRKEYSVLNKQYSKAEYESLVPRIIEHMKETGEWGEYFSATLSPFGYNETVAQDYFPLTKSEAVSRGFLWRDTVASESLAPTAKIPNSIKDVEDSILQETHSCEQCSKTFRLMRQELPFYRQSNIAPPDQCPNCRHLARIWTQNPRKLFHTTCASCATNLQTTYAPTRRETVLCESCYQQACA